MSFCVSPCAFSSTSFKTMTSNFRANFNSSEALFTLFLIFSAVSVPLDSSLERSISIEGGLNEYGQGIISEFFLQVNAAHHIYIE